jgi:hypothetical protein
MAASTAGLTPPEITSFQDQQRNFNDDRRPLLLGVSWSMWTFAAVAICLRFYAKRIMRNRFLTEDGLILLGLVRDLLMIGGDSG